MTLSTQVQIPIYWLYRSLASMMPLRSFKRYLIITPLTCLFILYITIGTRLHVQYIYPENLTEDLDRAANDPNHRINTTGCKIRSLPLYDEETRPLFDNCTETRWQCPKNLIHVQRFNETSILIDWSELDERPHCFHRKLTRLSDDYVDYGKFIGPLNSSTLDLPSHEFVHILCYDSETTNLTTKLRPGYNRSDSDILLDQIVPLVPYVNKTSDSSLPNVLLLAVDSMSYVNFKRHFTRTEHFLDTHKFFELRGYNKVGANTFPNMIPFLTGHHSHELVSDDQLKNTKFDNWPLIWKKFAEQGFVTAFDEEMPNYGLFHYAGEKFSKGFDRKPTDYDNRPFHYGIHWKLTNDYCYRDKAEFEHSLDWTLDMMRALDKRGQKFFAYISICQMTHDWYFGGHYMDVPYFDFFSKVFAEHLNEKTMILFFSDHGLRYGKLRETHSGEIENRLPFMFIYVPDLIEQKHRDNLAANQYRLTTAFDIHATLVHLVDGEANQTLPHGLSLFDSVLSEDRHCDNASIPSMYCSCYEDIPVTDPMAINPNQTLLKIVDKINSFSHNFRNVCAEYQLESINAIYNRSVSRTDTEDTLKGSHFYNVQFYLNPGHGLFETLIRGHDNNTRFEAISDITRISLYGNQSHCLSCDDCNEKFHKNYCFCKDLL